MFMSKPMQAYSKWINNIYSDQWKDKRFVQNRRIFNSKILKMFFILFLNIPMFWCTLRDGKIRYDTKIISLD